MERTRLYIPLSGVLVVSALALLASLVLSEPAHAQTAAPVTVTASTSQSFSFTQDLSLGSQGSEVSALQSYLASDPSIYPEGLVTGYYGSLTEAAVKRFQMRHGISMVGRVGPQTRAALNGATGGTNMTAGTGGSDDISAPVMSMPTVTSNDGTATVHWTTNEPAFSLVLYSTGWPFLFSVAPSQKDSSFDTDSSVILSGLTPNTTYYFVAESADASGNMNMTVHQSFIAGQGTASSTSSSQTASTTGTTTETSTSTGQSASTTTQTASSTSQTGTSTSTSATSSASTGTSTSSGSPAASSISVSGITSSGAVLTWTTDRLAQTKIFVSTSTPVSTSGNAYWTETSYGTNHAASVSGLAPNTTYHFLIRSTDSYGGTSDSNEGTFTTGTTSGSGSGY